MVELYNRAFATNDSVTGVTNDMSRALAFLTQQINDLPTTNAKLVTATLTNNASQVAHNLGYAYRGLAIVKKTASFDVFEDTTAINIDPKRYVMLKASTAGPHSVTILFF